MCTHEDALAYILGAPFIDDVLNYNSLTRVCREISIHTYLVPSLNPTHSPLKILKLK